MAGRVTLAVVGLLMAAAPVRAGVPAGAGLAAGLLGQWERCLERVGPGPGGSRAERYFRAAAQLRLGVRGPAMEELGALSREGGPFSGPALELAVGELFAEGRYEEVTRWAEASRAERFVDPAALGYRVGQSFHLAGGAARAERELAAVTEGPFLPYALHTRAQLAFDQGEPGRAVALLGQAVEGADSLSDPVVREALKDRLRLTRARVLYQAAVAGRVGPGDGRSRLVELARDQFDRIASDSVLFAEALRGRGWCDLELGRTAEALAAFETAAQLRPAERHRDLWAQGRVYERAGFYDEAAKLYAAAREAARAETQGGQPGAGEDLVAAPERFGRLGDLGRRAAAVDREADGFRELLAARRGFLDRAALRLEALGSRVDRVLEGLAALHGDLERHLDEMPAAALFPPAERGRIRRLAATQRRLTAEIASLEAVFAALERTTRWARAPEALAGRAQSLWRRLGAAGAALSGAQLRFLEGIKTRATQREAELVQATEALRGRAGELRASLDAAAQQLEAAEQRWADLAAAVEDELRGLEALHTEYEALERQARARTAAATEEARGLRIRRLLLAADRYGLDETQALHLWRERGGAR
ncbi:MAG: hypothetical protein Kow0092_26750 [Deferrisomatales bacterium]